jgi:hypothetical protein
MENTGTSDSETFPVIVLVSGERLLMRAVLLYEAAKVAEVAALKAQAAKKLQGFHTGIGFWGSPGWVLGGAATLGLVEGLLSSSAKKNGLSLLKTAAMKFQRLPETAVVFPPDQVQGLTSPHPENWSAVRKIKFEHDNRAWLAKTFGPTEQWYVHNGEDFVNIKTDAGMICIRWSHVASYVPPRVVRADASHRSDDGSVMPHSVGSDEQMLKLRPSPYRARPTDPDQHSAAESSSDQLAAPPPISVSFKEPMDFPKDTVVYHTGRRLVAILPEGTLIADDGAGGEWFDSARIYRDNTGNDGEWTWIRGR